MGSTGPNRSLSSGLIPQWMKNKVDTRFDFNETEAFSPPTLDDSFFYIRYKREENEKSKAIEERDQNFRPITQVLKEQNNDLSTLVKDGTSKPKVPNFTQHTVPCQQYLIQPGVKPDISKSKHTTSGPVRVKSTGTDDGFKGEGAACGTSIIQVANQMVSGKSITRGFQTQSFEAPCPSNNVHSDDNPPPGFDPFARRGSKSLPTTPLTSPNSSPKTRRKIPNRYFTGAFVDKYQGSWILAGLLGTREILSHSSSTIAEEETHINEDGKIKKATSKVEVNNVNMEEAETSSPPSPKIISEKPKATVFRPKPSELREMNFWSPTSM